MGTLVRFRRNSSMQFIDTCEELIGHTTFYLKRLPKSDRFIWVTDMCSLAKSIGEECVIANSIAVFHYEQDFLERRKHLQIALGKLNTFDFYLGILAKNENYYSAICKKDYNEEYGEDYPFIHWGELIDKERNLLLGVIEKDDEKYKVFLQKK